MIWGCEYWQTSAEPLQQQEEISFPSPPGTSSLLRAVGFTRAVFFISFPREDPAKVTYPEPKAILLKKHCKKPLYVGKK